MIPSLMLQRGGLGAYRASLLDAHIDSRAAVTSLSGHLGRRSLKHRQRLHLISLSSLGRLSSPCTPFLLAITSVAGLFEFPSGRLAAASPTRHPYITQKVDSHSFWNAAPLRVDRQRPLF